MDKYALVLAGGDEVDKNLLSRYIKESDFVIGADKGAETAYKYNFNIDLLVGDFDSINPEILNEFKNKIRRYPVEKDKTDLELALDIIVEKKYNNIVILNALGSRLDHTLGNLFLLEKFKNINIKIVDNNSETFLVNEDEILLKNTYNHILSIVPVSEFIQVEKLTGVKYPLENKTVNRGSTLCISNIVIDRECLISISRGRAFIIITNNMEE